MKKTIRQLLISSALLSTMSIYSQTQDKNCKSTSTVIKGTYHGKNLLFQNSETNGIQKILVDNKEIVSKFNSTAFELPLTNLKDGQKFEVKIVYCDATPPPFKILNADVIK
jgi:hypothetical protein